MAVLSRLAGDFGNAHRLDEIDHDTRLAGRKKTESIGPDGPAQRLRAGRRRPVPPAACPVRRPGRQHCATPHRRIDLEIDFRQIDDHAVRIGQHETLRRNGSSQIEYETGDLARMLQRGGRDGWHCHGGNRRWCGLCVCCQWLDG